MGSSSLRRRGSTAVGVYGAAGLGFLGTLVAARELGPVRFGLFSLVVGGAGFFQSLFDLTFEEAFVKYGFRYVEQEQWGRFHRIVRLGLAAKLGGAALAALGVLALAPFANTVFHGAHTLTVPLLIASALPLVQAPEGVGGALLTLRLRYDLRAALLANGAAFRLAGLWLGSRHGVVGAVLGLLLAQVVSTVATTTVGVLALRRFPAAQAAPLGEDRRPLLAFVATSSLGTTILSLRGTLLPLLLGVVSSPAQVGYLRVAQLPQTAFASLSSPVRMIFLAEQTRDVEQGRLHRLYRTLARYSLGAAGVLALVVPGLWIVLPSLLRLIRPSYGAAGDAARLVLLAAALELVFGWTKSFPVSIGRPMLRIVAHSLEAATIIPLVLLFGARWGATGAAGAALAGMVVFCGWWTVMVLRLRAEPPRPVTGALAP